MTKLIRTPHFVHAVLVAPWIGNVWGSEGIVTEKFIAVLAPLVQHLTVITLTEPDWMIVTQPTNLEIRIISSKNKLNIPAPFWYNLSGLANQETTTWQWGVTVAAQLKVLQQSKPIDLLITRYLPLDGVIAGFLFRNQFEVAWLQIFNDPFPGWCQPYFWPVSKNPTRILRDLWFQRRLLNFSRTVYSYPSALMRNWTIRKTWIKEKDANRIHVLHHVGIPDRWLNITTHEKTRQTPIIFRYLGNFYNWRNPGILLESWQQFFTKYGSQCYLEIYTHESDRLRALAYEKYKETNLTIYDAIPYREACRLIQKPGVLVHLEPTGIKEGIWIASKLADYMSTPNIICGWAPEKSEVGNLCRQFHSQAYFSNEYNAPGLVACFRKAQQAYLQSMANEKWFNPFSEKEVSCQLDCILANLENLIECTGMER